MTKHSHHNRWMDSQSYVRTSSLSTVFIYNERYTDRFQQRIQSQFNLFSSL